eukprot:1244276-Amphidinium_carterae.1
MGMDQNPACYHRMCTMRLGHGAFWLHSTIATAFELLLSKLFGLEPLWCQVGRLLMSAPALPNIN